MYDPAQSPTVLVSNQLPFSVKRIPPTITALDPPQAKAGSGDTTLRILGTALYWSWHVAGVATWFDGQKRSSLVTSKVSETELTAVVPAELLKIPGQAVVRVEYSDVMEGTPEGKTNDFAFTIE